MAASNRTSVKRLGADNVVLILCAFASFASLRETAFRLLKERVFEVIPFTQSRKGSKDAKEARQVWRRSSQGTRLAKFSHNRNRSRFHEDPVMLPQSSRSLTNYLCYESLAEEKHSFTNQP